MADVQRLRTGGAPKVIAVAWREFRHTVLTKGFIIGAVAVPVMMAVAIGAIAFLMGDRVRPIDGTLTVLDPSGTVAPLAVDELKPEKVEARSEKPFGDEVSMVAAGSPQAAAAMAAMTPKVNVKVDAVTDSARESELREAVGRGDLLGLAIVPADTLKANPVNEKGETVGFTLIVPTNSAPRTTALLERTMREAIVRARVAASGKDFDSLKALMRAPSTNTLTLTAEGTESRDSKELKMMVPAAFMFLLWIATFTSGNYLLTSTIEEKSSKVMEVLLSAVSPMQLLLGKILGYSLVSIVMLVSYGGLGLVGLSAGAMSHLVSVEQIIYLLIFFVMAYLFVATIMVSVGSAVSDLREAQSLVGPAMIVLMIPLLLWMPISDDPNGWLATIAGFVPPAIPFVMILRVTGSAESVPMWQIILSMVWGFGWVFVFLWGGAKIFRVGVLMQGKPPTPRELLRWIRTA